MERVLKIFATSDERSALADHVDVFEHYDAFVLAKAPKATAAKMAKKYFVEDITDQYTISLESRDLAPAPRIVRGVKAKLAKQGKKAPDKARHHYLVQFVGPIKPEWLKGIKKAGGEPREPYEGFCYVIRAGGAAIDAIRALPYVRWVSHLPHAERIERNVATKAKAASAAASNQPGSLPRTRVLPDVYVVEFFGPVDAQKAKPAVKKLGFEILAAEPKTPQLTVRATGAKSTRASRLAKLSAVHGVRMIRERTLDRPSNDVAIQVMNAAASIGNPGLKLDGTGEVIAICDTGLDSGDPNAIHPDFAGRVAFLKSYPITPELDPFIHNPRGDDGAADVDSGHGTHVAGSALGDGSASAALTGGSAPIFGFARKAKLVFQAVEQETDWIDPNDLDELGAFGLWGIPSDLAKLFRDAYQRNARIHSNSWGGGKPGEYDEQCRQLDEFVWKKKDFCVLVAAGNDGTDKDGDGKINPMSVTSPATAKNCITVGASENRRPEFNSEKYGKWWPQDYPKAPFKSDPMADDSEQVVAFSSRGPTKDKRIKPDVIAPGTFILSTRSRKIAINNMAWAAFPPSKLYFHMGGTSMATPLAAGAAALVRQYLRKVQGVAKPSAALVKAVLIAGATRLKGVGPAGAVCDEHQGYGRVNLDAILAPAAPQSARFLEISPGLATGKVNTQAIQVKSPDSPLRIVLAYSDFPGHALVNNLNLLAIAPNGNKFAGNVKPGTTQFDAVNNVEAIHVTQPPAGTWQISVIGSNVPKGPQEFALVVLGHLV